MSSLESSSNECTLRSPGEPSHQLQAQTSRHQKTSQFTVAHNLIPLCPAQFLRSQLFWQSCVRCLFPGRSAEMPQMPQIPGMPGSAEMPRMPEALGLPGKMFWQTSEVGQAMCSRRSSLTSLVDTGGTRHDRMWHTSTCQAHHRRCRGARLSHLFSALGNVHPSGHCTLQQLSG